jgi:hypothetical protein
VKLTSHHDKRRKSSTPQTPESARQPEKDSLDKFFSQYVNFDYYSKQPVWDEFNRMCNLFNWEDEDFEMREAKRNFKSAMVQQLNHLYGNNENDLESWRRLCRILNIQDIQNEVKACRKVSAGLLSLFSPTKIPRIDKA